MGGAHISLCHSPSVRIRRTVLRQKFGWPSRRCNVALRGARRCVARTRAVEFRAPSYAQEVAAFCGPRRLLNRPARAPYTYRQYWRRLANVKKHVIQKSTLEAVVFALACIARCVG